MTQATRQEPGDASGPGHRLRQAVESNRERLLDLGLRNNLLNYRLLKARGLELTGVDADEVFSALVLEGQAMRFAAVEQELPPPDGPAANGSGPRRRRRMVLPSAVSEEELQKRLLNTHDSTRTALEEQGINTLFLAFGMLHWYEDDSSNRPRMAPLVLVPVELRRESAAAGFTLHFTWEDVGTNLSLEAKLSSEFRIEMPAFDADEMTLGDYARAVEAAVSTQKRWEVEPDRVVLGQFSFNKFLMYTDLDLERWPDDSHPLEHPVLSSLLSTDGFVQQPSNYDDGQFLDDVVDNDEHPMVVDADSSQTLALLDVLDGRSMVIQGPPGTGKSQTITNLIAMALGQGKTVLFVAEKMAALEVVKRRLDELSLGDACLELHGTKTRKRRVLDDLSETMGLGEPRLPGSDEDLRRLGANREWLNRYCDALAAEIGDTRVTTYEALGHVVKTRATHSVDDWPAVSLPDVTRWSTETYQERESLVRELESARREVGDPAGHPLRGIRRSGLTPIEQERIKTLLDQSITTLNGAIDLNEQIATLVPAGEDDTPGAVSVAIETGRRAAGARMQGRIPYAHPAWHDRTDEVDALVRDGERLAELRHRNRELVVADAWSDDIDAEIDALRDLRGSPLRHLRWSYWKNKRALDRYLTEGAPAEFEDRFEVLLEVQEAQRLRESIDQRSEVGRELFPDCWNGSDSDWQDIRDLADSAISLHRDIDQQGLNTALPGALDAGVDRDQLAGLAESLHQTIDELESQRASVIEELEYDPSDDDRTNGDLAGQPLSSQRQLLEEWRASFARLSSWVAFQRALRGCAENELQPMVDVAWRWDQAGDRLLDLFHYRRAFEIVDRAWRDYSVLSESGADAKRSRVREFVQLDQRQLSWNQALLAKKHWQRLPDSVSGGEIRLLATEFQKKRRNLPIRQLIDRAGRAIQAIKPVFMMSPLSIANFIPPGSVDFDLVVFDEASQVAPVDAFGAILRGKQTVVVGDDRQLPPTQFFDKSLEQDEELDDEGIVSTQDLQSVLNLFLAQRAPQRMLRWHYRSQHESLISVSNNEFYGNNLVIFPSPARDGDDLGLKFHHLPEAVYDRGASKTNRDEAQQVAEAVMAHARATPHLTLGVAAFSISQSEAIRDHLEMLRRADPSAEAFFAEHEAEPFFVKNLENVQGDERDVIFISVGYGRDRNGRMSMNFGPLTRDGGERRLNVLITRARRRCEVFSSITDEDIDPSVGNRGVQALRTFLHFARTSEFPESTTGPTDVESPFEEAVRNALLVRGYDVHAQVGSAGYFIDLAVLDPDHPGRYLLAIECDGATYHSSRSSRDRDRLRQQVLERLGWTVFRIWSTDWFADPDTEIERLLGAIDHAREEAHDVPVVHPSDGAQGEFERRDNGREVLPGDPEPFPEYQFAEISLPESADGLNGISNEQLARAIEHVIAVEGPVHEKVLHRRVLNAAGLKRTTQNTESRIESIVERLHRNGDISVRGEFIWPPGDVAPPLRARPTTDQTERKLECVAPEEIDQAIATIVERSFSIVREEAVRLTVQAFGLQRAGKNAVGIIDERIDQLLETGVMCSQGGVLTVARAGQPGS